MYFLDVIFSSNKPIIIGRDVNVYLKEFPLLKLDVGFRKEVDENLTIFLGVDYTDDGLIEIGRAHV